MRQNRQRELMNAVTMSLCNVEKLAAAFAAAVDNG